MTDKKEELTSDETRDLMDSYAKILDVWKIQNDNYFKRVQLFMGVLQVGLFLAALKFLSLSLKSPIEALLLTVLMGIFGILSAIMWIGLNKKQTQYLEFCRTTLRNIESRLAALDVPLEYFTFESLVFGSYWDHQPLYSASLETVGQGKDKRCWLRFSWSQETYPKQDEVKGKLHSLEAVRGGMVRYEKRIAQGAICVWIILILIVLFTR